MPSKVAFLAMAMIFMLPFCAACSLCHNSFTTFLHYLPFAGVLYHAIVRDHLALTIWHSNIYSNDNVYWLVIDKWCHNQYLGLEDFLWAEYSEVLWRKLTEKL